MGDVCSETRGDLAQARRSSLTLYRLRETDVLPKSANKDTLPVHNIPFDSHWSAYLRIGVSSHERGIHFERNCFKNAKLNDLKNVSDVYYIKYTLIYSLFTGS